MLGKILIGVLLGVAGHQLRPLTNRLGCHTGDLMRYVIGISLLIFAGLMFANDDRDFAKSAGLAAFSVGLGVAGSTFLQDGSDE